jgi:hypothetical protein
VTAAVIVPVLAWLWTASRTRQHVEGNDLTTRETALLDIATEGAASFALIDEHSAANQLYQQVSRLWQTRLAPDDPRLALIEAHEGWVRTLAGDRLTTEQLFGNKPSWLGSQLGDRHPYTRMVRLALATTLEARGETAQAIVLRAEAERGTRDLLRDTGLPLAFDPDPVPPGLLAHVAPNAPAREGFRGAPDGGFFAPLTSTQRLIAAEQGWRLHVIATGGCHASVATVPLRVAVKAERSADARWHVTIEGAKPATALDAAPAETLGISLVKGSTGTLTAHIGARRIDLSLDDKPANRPDPPYALAFDGGPSGTRCAVVWLEIPFPAKAAFRQH